MPSVVRVHGSRWVLHGLKPVQFIVTRKKQPFGVGIPVQQNIGDTDGIAFRSNGGSDGLAYREWSDLELVASLADECGGAYAELYRRHSRSVSAIAKMILVNDDRCEDVVAEVFVALWSFPEKFDPQRGTLLSFLRVKTRGRCIDIVRNETARRRREAGVLTLPRSSVDSVDSRVLESEFAVAIRAGVSQLPKCEREAIELAFFSGLTYQAVAVQLGLPEGTVKSRIRAGLKRLQSNDGIQLLHDVTAEGAPGLEGVIQKSGTGKAS